MLGHFMSWKINKKKSNKKTDPKLTIILKFLDIQFRQKYLNRWTPEAYIHVPGNEIGLILQFWPTLVQHVKLVPSKEVDILLSTKHQVAQNQHCLPDASFADFTKCFKYKIKDFLIKDSNISKCDDCSEKFCALPTMSFFLVPGKDLPFCKTTETA